MISFRFLIFLLIFSCDSNRKTTKNKELVSYHNHKKISIEDTLEHLDYDKALVNPLKVSGVYLSGETDTIPPNITEFAYLDYLGARLKKLNCKDDFESLSKLKYLKDFTLTINNKNPIICSEIGKLSNLEQLTITESALTNLPNEIGDLKKLTYLDLSSNKLKTLPSTIAQLHNLEYLYLTFNDSLDIEDTIDKVSTLTNLKDLVFYGIPLHKIPKNITKLKNLKKLELLDFGECKLEKTKQKKIIELLPHCEVRFYTIMTAK